MANHQPDPEATIPPDDAAACVLRDRLAAAGWLCGDIIDPDGVTLECLRGPQTVLGRGGSALARVSDAARQIAELADAAPGRAGR